MAFKTPRPFGRHENVLLATIFLLHSEAASLPHRQGLSAALELQNNWRHSSVERNDCRTPHAASKHTQRQGEGLAFATLPPSSELKNLFFSSAKRFTGF